MLHYIESEVSHFDEETSNSTEKSSQLYYPMYGMCAYVHPILFYKYMNAGKKQINKQIGRIYQNTCTHTAHTHTHSVIFTSKS